MFRKSNGRHAVAATAPYPPADRAVYWHYAWVIVAIVSVMQMVGASTQMAFGVFIQPLSDNFGWGQGSITLAYAISSIVTALASPLAGWMGDRYGGRKTLALGSALFVVGMVLTGIINELWQLYLAFGFLIGVAKAIFLVPLIPASMAWFRRHLGLGMGVVMAGWGAGPALIAPLMGWMIGDLGWKGTFWITAAWSGALMAIMVLLFRDRPSDIGVLPYGARPTDPPDPPRKPDKVRTRVYTGYMRKTAAFWNMSSIHFLGCVGHAIILVYLIPLAVQEGISLVMAASLLTVMSGVSVVSRLLTPMLSDRYGPRLVMSACYFLQGVTVFILFWSHDPWTFYLFAVAFAVGYGGESGGFPILNRKYYGHAPMGSPYGFQMLGAGLGMALGGWIGGVVFDMTGGYGWALAISIAASLGGAVSILLLERTDRMLIPEWEKQVTPQLDVAPQPAASHVAADN
jgi:MFS family permease